jgi:hypothetical protein
MSSENLFIGKVLTFRGTPRRICSFDPKAVHQSPIGDEYWCKHQEQIRIIDGPCYWKSFIYWRVSTDDQVMFWVVQEELLL